MKALLTQLLRGTLFFVLALFGMTMAFIFMVSSAVAIAVLYMVARFKGRPFGAKAYWNQRHPVHQRHYRFRRDEVVDIKMRELP